MRVLRVNGEALLSILQIFTHNPLYLWCLDVKKLQDKGQGEAKAKPPATSGAERVKRGERAGERACWRARAQALDLLPLGGREPARRAQSQRGGRAARHEQSRASELPSQPPIGAYWPA